MAFLSLLIALALEQWRPLVDRRAVFAPMSGYAGFLERNFDAGEAQQGTIAWFLAVVPAVLAAWAIHSALAAANPLLALAFNVLVLYFTMGFRQHSHYFTDIHKALKDGDLEAARTAVKMAAYYEAARELAFRLTQWSKGLDAKERRFVVCTGGGPGIMEAANRGAAEADSGLRTIRMWPNDRINPLFEAVVGATEEAITNAMVAAETMTGADGFTVYALPHDRLQGALKKYGR